MTNLTKTIAVPRFRLLLAACFFAYTCMLFISTHIKLPKNALPGGSDKIAHFVAYAGLSFLLLIWISAKRYRHAKEIFIAFCACILFGVFDELLQIPVGRNCELLDWVADVIGASIGVSLFLGLRFFTPADFWVTPSENGNQHKL